MATVKSQISVGAKITKSRLLTHSILAIALPLLSVSAIGTDAFEALAVFTLSSTPLIWLAIFAIGTTAYCESRFLVSLAQLVIARGSLERVNAIRCDPGRVQRARHWKFAGATVCLTLLVLFLILEVVLRMFTIVPPEGKFPRGAAIDFSVDNSVNSRGLREPWESIAADDPRRRIAVLGDSFVYGFGVEREETFTSLLEQLLPNAITINMGVSGSNPKEQYAALLKWREEIRPEVVVHVIYLNDLDFCLGYLLAGIHYIPRRDSWVASQSKVFRYVEKTWQSRRAYAKTIEYFSGGETAEQRKKSWDEFEKYVTLTRGAVEDVGGEYLLVIFPWLYQLDDYPLRHVHARIQTFARALDVPMLDLLDTFEGMNGAALRVDEVDSHPNPAAHRIAADALRDFIEEQ